MLHETLLFSKKRISYQGNFCFSKCLSSAVEKFVLTINTHMANRVSVLFGKGKKFSKPRVFTIELTLLISRKFESHTIAFALTTRLANQFESFF